MHAWIIALNDTGRISTTESCLGMYVLNGIHEAYLPYEETNTARVYDTWYTRESCS